MRETAAAAAAARVSVNGSHVAASRPLLIHARYTGSGGGCDDAATLTVQF